MLSSFFGGAKIKIQYRFMHILKLLLDLRLLFAHKQVLFVHLILLSYNLLNL
jgi:hypothetical protein